MVYRNGLSRTRKSYQVNVAQIVRRARGNCANEMLRNWYAAQNDRSLRF